jgi:hypothetical protein
MAVLLAWRVPVRGGEQSGPDLGPRGARALDEPNTVGGVGRRGRGTRYSTACRAVVRSVRALVDFWPSLIHNKHS